MRKKILCFFITILILVINFSIIVNANVADNTIVTTDMRVNSISVGQIGDEIKYGFYKIDNKNPRGDEPIIWIIIQKDEFFRKALVLSKYVLDMARYDEGLYDTNWSKSSIRAWLNSDFYENSFSKEQKKFIVPTQVFTPSIEKHNEKGELEYKTIESPETVDYIFLPSATEIENWFNHDRMTENEFYGGKLTARETIATPYVEKMGLVNDLNTKSGVHYWLRSMSQDGRNACYVNRGGGVDCKKGQLVSNISGVRPAMWLFY